mmetsp:Transcript_47759/g.138030  ORF Transcript_47759/g.138030 Transcript_47759/m.138030 type:complete len:90 (+) Transcript_47759:1369-1638(+)
MGGVAATVGSVTGCTRRIIHRWCAPSNLSLHAKRGVLSYPWHNWWRSWTRALLSSFRLTWFWCGRGWRTRGKFVSGRIGGRGHVAGELF